MEKFPTEKKIVDINLVVPNPHNPNNQSEFIYERMKQAIKEEGLFGSIIVHPWCGQYQILDGEHRVRACKELGYTQIPIECALQEMPEDQVKFWTVFFNNTRGRDDVLKRAKLLEDINQGQSQLLPFTEQEIENEKKLIQFDFTQFQKKEKEGEIEEDSSRTIMFSVPEELYLLWANACTWADQNEKLDKQEKLFAYMLEEYLDSRIEKEFTFDESGKHKHYKF